MSNDAYVIRRRRKAKGGWEYWRVNTEWGPMILAHRFESAHDTDVDPGEEWARLVPRTSRTRDFRADNGSTMFELDPEMAHKLRRMNGGGRVIRRTTWRVEAVK